MRGTVSQIALAEWIIRELDKPAVGQTPTSPNPATYEYRNPVLPNHTVRIFYGTQADTPQRFQETVNMVRSTAKIQRLVAYFPLRAIVWRGTSDQSLQAERLLRERANPATQ